MSNHRQGYQWSMGAAGPVIAALADDQPGEWADYAACAEVDPEIFFPDKGGNTKVAKTVCAGCFVKDECLEYAMARDERFGLWGGLTREERKALQRERRAA